MKLKPYAVANELSRGRHHDEQHEGRRDPFQLDRDRILHCRAFRRLSGKTQVFVPREGDHYRTRLTHSLEVAQISRDMARQLGLNEDLAEAIALAHDLGHTPFGHAGEHALHECLKEHGMEFEHNAQSYRTVTELEQVYPDFVGLNLSIEVLEGLMKHQTSWDNPSGNEAVRPSLEAQLVNFGDEIAYQNHDIDDGLRSGYLKEKDLEHLELWQKAIHACEERYGSISDPKVRIARQVSTLIGLMIKDLCEETEKRLAAHKIQNLEEVYSCTEKLVGFSETMTQANKTLKDFLMARLYLHPEVVGPAEQGQQVLKALFAAKVADLEQPVGAEALSQLRDYLAGMTDHFAQEQAQTLGLLA